LFIEGAGMAEKTQWDKLGAGAREAFQNLLVPAVFGPWAEELVGIGAPAMPLENNRFGLELLFPNPRLTR